MASPSITHHNKANEAMHDAPNADQIINAQFLHKAEQMLTNSMRVNNRSGVGEVPLAEQAAVLPHVCTVALW